MFLSNISGNPNSYPKKALKFRTSFEFDLFDFKVDPIRRFLNERRYVRSYTPREWENAYFWVGWGESCCNWKVKIEILELPPEKMGVLDESWFVASMTNAGLSAIGPFPPHR